MDLNPLVWKLGVGDALVAYGAGKAFLIWYDTRDSNNRGWVLTTTCQDGTVLDEPADSIEEAKRFANLNNASM